MYNIVKQKENFMENTDKRKWWQSLIKVCWIFVLGIFMATILMSLVYSLPTSSMKVNIENSYKILSEEGEYHNVNSSFYKHTGQLDNFTDALMLNQAYYNNVDLSAIEKAMLNQQNGWGIEGLFSLISGNTNEVNSYARYWHGYLVFLKPMLFVMGISGIRIFNLILQTLLIVSICVLMWKSCKRLIIPYISSLLFISPFVISQSLQFSSIFYIMNIAMLLILLLNKRLDKSNSFIYFFLILGMVTSFIDLLTYPMAAFLMPLILVMYLRRNKEENLKQKLLFMLKVTGCFFGGYVFFWASKWLVSSLILNQNMFTEAFKQIAIRTNGEVADVSSVAVHFSFIKNLKYLFNIKNLVIGLCALCAAIVLLVVYRKKLKYSNKNFVPYLILAFVPVVWFLISSNHSYIHAFFTSKTYVASIFAIFAMFVSFFEEKLDNKVVALEEQKDEVTSTEKAKKRDKIAVIIPCYNEHLTIEKTVKRYKEALPEATIYVYDNNSKDGSDKLAKKAGAIVRYETNQGKGYVVRSMFKDIEADCYFMVDADDTYMADNAKQMCDLVLENKADMVIGDRLSSTYFQEEKRKSHTFGNKLVRFLINTLYHTNVKDIMTGQRAFSYRFVKTFECKSNGFEIETEMTIFACDNNMTITEIPVNYVDRPKGSFSKLNTYKDGFKVLKTIFKMYLKNHPLKFFGLLSLGFAGLSLLMMILSLSMLGTVASASLAIATTVFSALFVTCNLSGELISNISKKKGTKKLSLTKK